MTILYCQRYHLKENCTVSKEKINEFNGVEVYSLLIGLNYFQDLFEAIQGLLKTIQGL